MRIKRDRSGDPIVPPDEVGSEPIELPIEDSIDLHPFRPREIGDLVDDYLDAASRAGFVEVRIIHGRGTGSARSFVRARLARRKDVLAFVDAPEERGGIGATIVRLAPTPAT